MPLKNLNLCLPSRPYLSWVGRRRWVYFPALPQLHNRLGVDTSVTCIQSLNHRIDSSSSGGQTRDGWHPSDWWSGYPVYPRSSGRRVKRDGWEGKLDTMLSRSDDEVFVPR